MTNELYVIPTGMMPPSDGIGGAQPDKPATGKVRYSWITLQANIDAVFGAGGAGAFDTFQLNEIGIRRLGVCYVREVSVGDAGVQWHVRTRPFESDAVGLYGRIAPGISFIPVRLTYHERRGVAIGSQIISRELEIAAITDCDWRGIQE